MVEVLDDPTTAMKALQMVSFIDLNVEAAPRSAR
jgi:hypothetical protein